MIIECCADLLARWEPSDGRDRTIVAAVATAARSHPTTAAERRRGLGQTSDR